MIDILGNEIEIRYDRENDIYYAVDNKNNLYAEVVQIESRTGIPQMIEGYALVSIWAAMEKELVN